MNIGAKQKPELILHVGFHKTGSSSIQETFSRLEFDDLAYAKWGQANHSGPFQYAFKKDKTEINNVGNNAALLDRAEKIGERFLNQLRKELVNCKKQRILFSAEAMSQCRDEDALVSFLSFVRPHVSNVSVFGYVRAFADLSASRFQQTLKMGKLSRFPYKVTTKDNIQMLDRVFGDGKVTFLKFDRETLHEGDVVLDFAKHLNVSVTVDEIVRANESISLEAIAILYCNLQYGVDTPNYVGRLKVQRSMVEAISAIGTTPFRYSQAVVDAFEAQDAENICWVQDRLNMSMASKARNGGIDSDDDLIAIAVGCEDKLLEITAELPRTRRALLALDKTADGPVRIAAIVDIMKNSLRHSLVQTREAALQ